MKNRDPKIPKLEDIEEHETAQWLDQQLDRIEQLIRENGADEDMLEAISYLRDENDQWFAPDIQGLAQSGKLSLIDDDDVTH
ncbi:MAG: cytochrome P450 [Novosphingobium sp.]|nr:cytochrome P450 [Novosphingobium sp.]